MGGAFLGGYGRNEDRWREMDGTSEMGMRWIGSGWIGAR
jgi:hypothetical protein